MSDILIEKNVSLAPLTTFKVGGPAEFFVEVKSIIQLQKALKLSRDNSWPVFILAGGSNLIVSDEGFRGLVINLKTENWKLKIDRHKLTTEASVPMSELVKQSIEAGLAGLEWSGGLPGSFGGAIRGNAGCFGGEIKDSILSVKSNDIETGQENFRNNIECQFGYRDSIFKHNKEVIIEATVELRPGNSTELRSVADDHIRYRQDRQPLEYPNAGSIFKNVPLEQVPNVHLPLFTESVKNDPFPVVPTAKILAVAGLKGWRVGDAQLSEKHSNYIVNLGGAMASDIVALIEKIKTEIQSKYQINLEVEPELVGF